MTQEEREAWLKAMTATMFDAVLNAIQGDPHQWSERPCETCRAVSGLVGRPFGCYVYAGQRQAQRKAMP